MHFRSLSALLLALGSLVPVLTVAEHARAHNRVELSATAGYRFGGRARVQFDREGETSASSGRFVLEGSPSFGALVGYRVQHNAFAYFSYSRQQTTVRYDEGAVRDLVTGTMAVEYYQVGGNMETTRGLFVPYLGASVGFARYRSFGGGADRLFFAPALDGGLKVDLHKNVHLRVLGRLPIVFSSGSLYCRDDSGCIEQDRFAPIVQGEVQAGIGLSF